MQGKNKFYCFDCGRSAFFHIETYLDDLFAALPFIEIKFVSSLAKLFEKILEKTLLFLGLLKYEKINNLDEINIPLKLKLFLKELLNEYKNQNINIFISKSIFEYTHNFIVEINGKKIKFSNLPVADFLNPKLIQIDNKIYVKNKLMKNNFPVAPAKIFWLWQKKKALKYAQKIGWPIVLKPNSGSVARHVYINISNESEFNHFFKKVIEYSPRFIVEKFVEGFVWRITVIDFNDVFCVKQVPANVLGDGKSTILELINKKNKNRAMPHSKNATLYKILKENISLDMLALKGYNLNSIPQKGEIVYLVKEPYLRFGGDLVESTEIIHPENKKLFLNIAKLFNIRVVGIDFIAKDISLPWDKQECAILELNTSPSIEMHMFVSSGIPKNLGKNFVNFFKKYYL